ncbi:16571_t:CDS:1 [Dentiscutata heterogama]|uniref:16571_t:CDS:1 n=1 Tax=Dentiscutata heterogama TaxID=1316150 RepID=A0ACA9K8W8_9GLOM|nr:16571_t:CDS:1 [Dentiscutata heterogama]
MTKQYPIFTHFNSYLFGRIKCKLCKKNYINPKIYAIKQHFARKHSEEWLKICDLCKVWSQTSLTQFGVIRFNATLAHHYRNFFQSTALAYHNKNPSQSTALAHHDENPFQSTALAHRDKNLSQSANNL